MHDFRTLGFVIAYEPTSLHAFSRRFTESLWTHEGSIQLVARWHTGPRPSPADPTETVTARLVSESPDR